MSRSILIAGCGYVGTALAREWLEQGHTVWGLRRSVEALKDLQGPSFHELKADITKSDTLSNLPSVDRVVICVAPDESDAAPTARCRPTERPTGAWPNGAALYRKTYVEGVKNLLNALKSQSGLERMVYISSTSVYGQSGGVWVDENSPTKPAHKSGKILLEAEKQVLDSGMPSIVFRLGGIYGPGRNRISFLKKGHAEMDEPDDYINLIHVSDVVAGTVCLLAKGKLGEIYLGVDDKPVTRREYFSGIAEMLGVPPPVFQASEGGSFITARTNKRGRNQKLKSLGFDFKYPTFREGYAELLRSERAQH